MGNRGEITHSYYIISTLPKTNIAPEKWWLGNDPCAFAVSFREGNLFLFIPTYVPWSKVAILGTVIQPLIGNPSNGAL